MTPPTTGARRLARASAVATAAMLLALGAHHLGGGALPPVGVLALSSVPVWLGSMALTARRVRLPVLLPLLGVAQLVLHQAFTVRSAGGCWSSTGGHHPVATACAPLPEGAASAMTMGPTSGRMLLAHAAATALTAWFLCAGERWLWRVLRAVVGVAAAVTVVQVSRARAGVPASRVVPVTVDAGAGAAPRGPPARACAAA